MIIVLILALLPALHTQGATFVVLPDSFYNLTQASAQACYANCQSCQSLTNQCEECYAPYFVKAQDGSCQLSNNYTLESSTNELMAGTAFIYTSESWGNILQTDCQPNPQNLNAPLRVLGPFTAGSNISYQRTISVHQYLIVSFSLIKMSWDSSSLLTIALLDQNNNLVTTQTIKNTPSVPKQKLCSASASDQRFAVVFQVADLSVTTLKVNFTFTGTGSWAIATWALITGICDSSCSNCSYSNDPTQCIGCNSFFIMGSDSKCSQCFTGFQLVTTEGISSCVKCPIEYQNCNPGQQICFYSGLNNQINSSDCTFTFDSDYGSTYDVNILQFPGSLFTAAGKSATYTCGSYSLVGPAQQGDPITRIFSTLQVHYLISVTFNIFVIDQNQATQTNLFIIILDNVILQAAYITTQGISNVCGGSQLEAFVTYPATKFYFHTKDTNVNLTITSNAINWGIRNLRLAFQICDSTCLLCGPQGCLQCQSYFTLENLKCLGCPAGFGLLNQSNTCTQCPENCLSCMASIANNKSVTTCLVCTLPYFLFEQKCIKRTNVADKMPILNSPASPSSGSWTVQTSPATSSSNCSVNLPSRNNATVNFTISQNNLKSQINTSQTHYRKIVQFYLMKIDDWDPTDRLQLYLNDLLVLQKNYSSFGNSICGNPNQTDLISFESIEIDDSNSSLSVSFEVVSVNSTARRFGVSNFQFFPVGCENCENYPFKYKLDYNYDNALNIHIEFNRVYVNNNVTLFQQIFWLLINGNRVNYSNIWNNTVTYVIQSYPSSEVINANVTLICQFPELVQTQTQNSINQDPFFYARLLQANTYQNLKVIDNNSSYIQLQRYTPPSNSNSINGIRIFFEVVSRAVIYLGFAFFFIGCQTSCTHFMHNLQKIWLHIFIAALAAPSALRFAFVGFRQTQNQNIAINPTSWQSAIPLELYYNTPSFFQQYYTDIGFMRNIYNIAIAFLILVVCSFILNLILGRCDFSRNFKDNILWRHLRITFVKRPFFVFNSIVFYQYLTLVLACTLQFTGFFNTTNKGAFGGINGAGAIVAFIIATLYPLFHLYYLQKRRRELDDGKIEYANRYGEIFYRFLPQDVWVEESEGITYAEQMYNLYRFGEIWWMCIVATLLYNSPQAQCFLLLITNLVHMVMILFTSLSTTIYFKLGKVFELAFFAGLEILILVCQSQQDTLTTSAYNTLGSVGIAFLFAIILLSFMRAIYTFVRIYREYNIDPENNKYTNIKTRNQDYFTTKGSEALPSQRDN